MKRSKFSEEQILTILRGAPGGDRFRDRSHPEQRVRGHRLTHRRVGHAKGAGPDRRAAGKLHDNDTGYAVRLHPRARCRQDGQDPKPQGQASWRAPPE
jgi:hypothetical protein